MALTWDELYEIQNKNKKKKKKEEEQLIVTQPYSSRLILPKDEIAPVKTVTSTKTTTVAPTVTSSKKDDSKKEDDRTWFKKGSGGVVSTILGTVADIGEDLGTGIIGMGEKAVDALAMIGTTLGNAQMSQLSNDELAFSAVKNIGKDKKTKEKEAESIVKKYTTAQKDAKKVTTEFVKKDLYSEADIAKKIITTPFQNATGINVEESSVLGDKSDALIQSGGQLLATAGLSALGVPWFLTTGATSFGAEAENALNQGATYEQATMSAAISAGAEILTEKLSGGIKFGGKTLDDALLKPLTEKISSKALKTLTNLGLDALGEGTEEVVSGVLSNLGTALYKEEDLSEILFSEEAVDEYIESFIGGAALGGFSSGVRAVANRNAIELDEKEQKVFDKVVEDKIAEATEDGKKSISKKEESEIRNDVLRSILNGSLDTDKIESILGGEEYEKYKKVVDTSSAYEAKLNDGIKQMQAKYDELQAEYDKLNELDLTKAKLGDYNQQNKIKEEMASLEEKIQQWETELDEYKNDTKTNELKTNLKTKLGQNVYELVKDSRLAESYREVARSKQKFDTDTSKYKNENARQTVQNAIDSGLFRNTNADHDAVDLIAKATSKIGLVVEFTTNEKAKNDYIEFQTNQIAELESIPEAQRTQEQTIKLAKMKEALAKVQSGKRKVNGSTKKGVITINLDSVKPVEFITGHELLHNLIKSKVYKNGDLHKAFKSYLGDEKYAEKLKKVEQTYEGNEATPEEELAANLVGEYIFNDYDFVMHLATTNHNIFQNAWDSIKHLYNMATAGSKEARELERVKRNFEKAYKEAVKTGAKGEGTKYDVVALKNGNVYVKASRKVVNGTTVDEMRKDISRFFNRLLEENSSLDIPTIDGDVLTITKTETADKARDNYKTVNNQRVKMTDDEFTVKMHIEAHIDEVAEVSMPAGKKSDSKAHSFAKDGFTYRKAYFEDFDGEYYEVTLSIGQNGTVATVYNVGKIEKSVLPSAKISAVVGSKPLGKTLSEKSISQNSEKSSSEKHSLSETDNEYLSAVNSGDTETAQRMVDEAAKKNGYTVKGLHATNADFTVFDINKTSENNFHGKGIYFTNSTQDVEYNYENHEGPDPWWKIEDRAYELAEEKYGFSYEDTLTGDADIIDKLNECYDEAIEEFNSTIHRVTAYLKFDNPLVLKKGESSNLSNYDLSQYDGIIDEQVYENIGHSGMDENTVHYVVFNPRNIKSADAITYDDNGNVIPLSERFKVENNDIRFSLSENVEETKDLMALHNLHSNELMKQLKMGGIAYPSVAVTKPGTLSHEGFGDITLILNKDAIDPKKSKYNKLYSADAYTPTFPNVNYEANRDVANNIADKVKSLYDAIPEDYKRSLTAFRDFTNIDERLNSARGEQGLIERYADDYSFKQLYLADKGEVVPTEIKRTETQITEYQKENYQFVVDKLGAELLEASKPMDSYTPPLTARLQWYEQYGDALKEAYADYWCADDSFTLTKEEALEIANSESARYWVRELKAITDYIKTGGITIKEEADINATNALIDEKINVAEYKEWLSNLFSGIEGSSGIRNSKDLFTPSGKRRSFSQLHDPVTIDNVIKVMRKQGQTGQGAFGTGNIQGASTQEFGSITEMKANSDRLGVMDEAEHKEITQQINDRIFEIAERYSNGKDLMDAQTTIVEAVSKNETKAGIARYLKQFDHVYKYTDSIGDDIIELRDYIRSLPTPYFEAKPQRAVSFDEVAAFVIPRDADIKVKQELLNKGYSIAEYDPKVEGDRQRVVNSFEEYKFSLSDTTETSRGYATFYGRKIANRNIPLADIAPTVSKTEKVAPTVAEKSPEVGTVNEDDYAPMTEAEAEAMYEADKDYINSFTDADMPPEMDAPIYSADTSSVDEKALKNISAMAKDILFLTPKERRAIEDVVQKYSTSESQNETDLFNSIKELFGEKSYTERIEEVAEMQQVLKGYKINVSPFIKRDITDYTRFMRSNFGKIGFSKEGMSVDTAYMELSEAYPSFFPSDIVNPTDQLLQIADVANMTKEETQTFELDDDVIQEATDVITEAVSSYKENQLLKATEKGSKAALRDELKKDKEAQSAAEKARKQAERDALSKLSPLERYKRKAYKRLEADKSLLKEELDEAEYNRQVEQLEAETQKKINAYKVADQRKTKQQEYKTQMESLIGDTSTWKDKKLGISYEVNTLRRNLRDVIRDENGKRDIAKADAIYDELQGKYNHNEAELNRESNQIKQKFAEMNITKAEDRYIQMLGEFRHNPETTLTEEVVNDFYEKHKKHIDEAKVDKIIEEARSMYDDLLTRVNQVLSEQGMKEIPYRKGYFPHFTEEKQGFLGKLFNWKTQNNEIPTSIAGLTEMFEPNRSWQTFNKQRKTDVTDYSFTKGLDNYVQGSLDWIYHIEDIQKRRAFENQIRYTHSEEGIKEKIDAIFNSEEYDADEMQEQIDLVYREARNPLNNFVQDFHTATNTLAGKKSTFDRDLEQRTNRRVYSVMTNLSNRVSGNMVAGSVSSALTNFIPITQSWVEVSPVTSLRAMKDTIASTIRDDGTVNKSDFLTNRLKKAENLYQTNWDKIGKGVGFLMDVIDGFTSQTVWRSKYIQNMSRGMSESEAIKNADIFAANVMADRSRGNQPTLFDSKSPVAKIFTAFQLEVNNQYGYFFKDAPQDIVNKSKARLAMGYATAFFGAYAYNALYSSLTGRDAAFDPIGIIEDLLKDLGFGGDDDEEEEIAPVDVALNLTNNILEEIPFIGGLLGGGRIPISSAMPYGGIMEAFEGTLQDISEGNVKTLTKEWLNPVYYLALPMGGGQIRKTNQGLAMFSDDHPVAGSYTDSGNLRFPVEDNLKNRVQAGVFGQYANENARTYFDEDYAPLKEKQIKEYAEADMPIADYWKYREGLKDFDKQAEKAAYINGLDISKKQKDVLKSYLYDEEGYKKENPEKYAFLEKEGIGYIGYKELDEDTQSAWSWAFKHQDEYEYYKENGVLPGDYSTYYIPMLDFEDEDDKAYSWAFDNPEKATLGRVFSEGVKEYRQYSADLDEIRADKDSSGKTISGSAKEKKKAYIWSLPIEYGQKVILYRSLYDSKDDKATYNQDIIDYLISRDDITYDEMNTICEELGFDVNRETGQISW